MSFFDDSSLAFLPSGAAGKDGKAYSIKPTDGTGDFTFSRGSNLAATRVGPTGLIEKGRENLLLQSNQFDTTWADGGDYTITSGQSGYDGSSDAWLLNKNTTGNDYLRQSSLSTDAVNTFSFYAKEGSVRGVKLVIGGQNVAIDLRDGSTISTGGASNLIAAGADLVSGTTDWYRIYLTKDIATTAVLIKPTDENGADASGSIYIQDAQLEIGLAASEPIESGATTGKAGLLEDEPRFDYSGGATCPSLLLEPSRTQLVTSEYFEPSATDWRSEGTNGVTITTNDTTSPEGLVNASKLQGGGASNDRLQWNFNTSNTKAVYSLFVKGAGDAVRFSLFNSRSGDRLTYDVDTSGNFTLNAVTGITNHDIENYGNGWYRIWGEFTTDAALTNYFQIYSDITGSGAIYLYGAQLESGSYPTSYIPNHSGGTITRGADSCTGAGDASTFNDDEGVLYAEIATLANDGTRAITLSDGGNSNSIFISYNTTGRLDANLRSGGIYQAIFNYTGVANPSEINKIAFKYKQNDFALWVNGVEVGTDSSGITPIGLDILNLSVPNAVLDFFFGNINQVLYFPTALSDADLATLTT